MQTVKLLLCVSYSLFAAATINAQTLNFPLDATPVIIDGVMNASEWANAGSISIPVSGTDSVQVKFKHDGTAMYFAFYGKLQSANALFPEVLTDAANVGGSSWVAGQWWLHVSATDCENEGGYGIYNNCAAVQPGWEGAPNFIMTGPPTDTVEMRVPFSKVGFNPATMETMGMVMMVTNTATIFKTYPTTADRNIPSTWGKATFSKFPVGVDAPLQQGVKLYPNPAHDVLYLSGISAPAVLHIADITGGVLETIRANKRDISIPLSNLPAGTYFVSISGAAENQMMMFTVNK